MRANGLLLMAFVLSPHWAFAAGAGEPSCPVRYKLNSLCSEIQSRSEASIPVRKNPYNYYNSILEASCVTDSDSTEAMNDKVSVMWDQLEREGGLTCSNTLFAIPGGSVIKFDVAMNFDRFIHDVTRWGVNLNRMDPVDGRTVLDYVRDERLKYAVPVDRQSPSWPRITTSCGKQVQCTHPSCNRVPG